MNRKEDTPMRVTRRKYEATHSTERKQKNTVWGTSMNRADFEELNKFLKDNRITKVQLIYAGWAALKQQINHK